MRILIVEDERTLREGLTDLLRGAQHETDAVADGLSAVEQGGERDYDLVLLDLMLPRLDGFEVCRRLRLLKPHLAILMLTARGAEDDKVKGLLTGADDYMTKPFGVKELLARIEVLGRRARAQAPPPEILEADGVRFDFGRHAAKLRDGREVALTPRESGILRLLHRNRARVVSRGEFLEQVWGLKPDTETRTVDVTLGNLRHKIESDPAKPRIILSVKGAGYAWGGDG